MAPGSSRTQEKGKLTDAEKGEWPENRVIRHVHRQGGPTVR